MSRHINPTEAIINLLEGQLRLLGQFDIDVVIVGGVAATLHGSELPTTDLDVAIRGALRIWKNWQRHFNRFMPG